MSTNKTNSARDAALQVVTTLRAAGHVAYFAGGCVRDMLLGETPKDYDVATDAPPDRVMKLFKRTQAVGAAFGVVLVRENKQQIEVATFRTDGKYEDGRRPESVTFTTAEHDARRRDFTINGLFYDPIENRVIDYVGGEADLYAKIVRAIGDPDRRFEEDHLRLLRAVRFAARLNFGIDADTWDAIERHAPQLSLIAAERVGDEVRRIFTGVGRTDGWCMLQQSDLSLNFFDAPRVAHASRADTIVRALPDVRLSFPTVLAAAVVDYFWVVEDGLAAVLHSAFVRKTADTLRRTLALTNDERAELIDVLDRTARLLGGVYSQAAFMRHLASPYADGVDALLTALASADRSGTLEQKIGRVRADLDALRASDFRADPFVTGDDLIAAGLSPGPVFKRILDTVYDAQLEGRVTTKAAALAMALDSNGG